MVDIINQFYDKEVMCELFYFTIYVKVSLVHVNFKYIIQRKGFQASLNEVKVSKNKQLIKRTKSMIELNTYFFKIIFCQVNNSVLIQ